MSVQLTKQAYAEHYYGGITAYTVYLNGTDEWAIWRDEDNSLYSREADDRDGVLFRAFYNSHQYQFDDVKMFDGADAAVRTALTERSPRRSRD